MRDKVSVQLLMLADVIDSEASPSRSMVASVLREILAAVPKPKIPIQFPPMGGGIRGNPKTAPRGELPPSLQGIVPKKEWFPGPQKKAPGTPKRPGPKEVWDDPKEDVRVRKQLESNRQKIVRENPEMESFESFAEFLTDNDRDSYTVAERTKFCEAHQMKHQEFEEFMKSTGKYRILNAPVNGVYAPAEVMEMASKELGVPVSELEKFVRGFDEDVKRRFLVDSTNIVDTYLEHG
jgi:hypothetical protein